MKTFWNERYKQEKYAYGKVPNSFFREKLSKLQPGNILLPSEGEGRNAVYAATLNWDVSAFDISEEGKNKAEKLAKENFVSIKYLIGNFPNLNYQNEQFDVIALIFAHYPTHIKKEYFPLFDKKLKSGGLIIFEGFSKNNLKYKKDNPNIGGPKNINALYTTDELKSFFNNYDIIELEEKEIELQEGLYHNGRGSVVRFVGKKKY